MALYALNIEIARIRDVVSQPALGEIRLQWWLDAIDLIYAGDTPAHPVTEALAPAIERGNLSKASLHNMIEARRFDLFDDPMPSLNDLEGYLGETSAALLQMTALMLDRDKAQGCSDAAGLAGVATGIAGLLRLLPTHRRRGQCYLPADILRKHGLAAVDLIAGQPEQALSEALRETRDVARKRLEQARAQRTTIAPEVFPAFLPASLTEIYLDRLSELGAAALRRAPDISQLRRQWRLYWCARRSAF